MSNKKALSNLEDVKKNVMERVKIVELDPENFMKDDGSITNKNSYNSLKKICIMTEDRGNGFQFFRSYLYYNYPDISGIMVGVGGYSNFKFVIPEYIGYDAYIIIIDRGAKSNEINTIWESVQFLRENSDARIFVFKPQCLEEILISFYKITDFVNINKSQYGEQLMQDMRSVLKGTVKYIEYGKYRGDGMNTTKEQLCEQLIYELTKDTPFEYFHGSKKIKGKSPRLNAYMSPCWRCNCCEASRYDNLNKVDIFKCKKPDYLKESKNKMDFIAKYSLLCGLTYIIDKVYGNRYHNKGYWNNMSEMCLEQLVEEV